MMEGQELRLACGVRVGARGEREGRGVAVEEGMGVAVSLWVGESVGRGEGEREGIGEVEMEVPAEAVPTDDAVGKAREAVNWPLPVAERVLLGELLA